jgi:hypothetical protein
MDVAGKKGDPKMTPRITQIPKIFFSEISEIGGSLFVLGARK